MSDRNQFWKIAENYLLARFEGFRPEPKPFVDSIKKDWDKPGSLVNITGGYAQILKTPVDLGSPTITLLKQLTEIEQQRLEEKKFVDAGRLEGLHFYDELKEKAEKNVQKDIETLTKEAQEVSGTVDIQHGSRLKSLYGAGFEIRDHYEDETKRLNTKMDKHRPNEN